MEIVGKGKGKLISSNHSKGNGAKAKEVMGKVKVDVMTKVKVLKSASSKGSKGSETKNNVDKGHIGSLENRLTHGQILVHEQLLVATYGMWYLVLCGAL